MPPHAEPDIHCEDGIFGIFLAVPAFIFMSVIHVLLAIYGLMDNVVMQFQPEPLSGGCRNRRPKHGIIANALLHVIHFILQVIELPVFLAVFTITAVVLSLLAVNEIILRAFLIKFRNVILAGLIFYGLYSLFYFLIECVS